MSKGQEKNKNEIIHLQTFLKFLHTVTIQSFEKYHKIDC